MSRAHAVQQRAAYRVIGSTTGSNKFQEAGVPRAPRSRRAAVDARGGGPGTRCCTRRAAANAPGCAALVITRALAVLARGRALVEPLEGRGQARLATLPGRDALAVGRLV